MERDIKMCVFSSATTAYAARGFGKTGEDSKINKATSRFHKTDAASKRNFLPTNLGINQLPSSTYLIPISTNAMSITEHSKLKNSSTINRADPSEIRLIDPFTHSGNITYINKSKSEWPNSSRQDPNNRDKHQSYLIVKQIPEPTNFNGGNNSGQNRNQNNTILNYQLSSPCGYSTTHGQPELPLTQQPQTVNKRNNRRSEPNTSTGKKSSNRSLPGLNRIIISNNQQYRIDSSSSDEDNPNDKNVSGFGNLLNPLFSGILMFSNY